MNGDLLPRAVLPLVTPSSAATGREPLRLEDGEGVDDLRETRTLLLVECYTNGCSMCGAMEPVLGNVARVTDATVAMVDAGYAFDLAERYSISSVPTLLLFEDGDLVGRLADGFRGTDAVVSFVEGNRKGRPRPPTARSFVPEPGPSFRGSVHGCARRGPRGSGSGPAECVRFRSGRGWRRRRWRPPRPAPDRTGGPAARCRR